MAAFELFRKDVRRRKRTAIDPYAAESPAEFFAVMSEAFFEIPFTLRQEYPEVYRQLAAFYRQDTAARARCLITKGNRRSDTLPHIGGHRDH